MFRPARRPIGYHGSSIGDIVIGETLVVLPNEICPVDGVVVSGHGAMDESYLTGEPFQISKVPGCSAGTDEK